MPFQLWEPRMFTYINNIIWYNLHLSFLHCLIFPQLYWSIYLNNTIYTFFSFAMGNKSSKKLKGEDLKFLTENTQFSKKEIKAWYAGFMVSAGSEVPVSENKICMFSPCWGGFFSMFPIALLMTSMVLNLNPSTCMQPLQFPLVQTSCDTFKYFCMKPSFWLDKVSYIFIIPNNRDHLSNVILYIQCTEMCPAIFECQV